MGTPGVRHDGGISSFSRMNRGDRGRDPFPCPFPFPAGPGHRGDVAAAVESSAAGLKPRGWAQHLRCKAGHDRDPPPSQETRPSPSATHRCHEHAEDGRDGVCPPHQPPPGGFGAFPPAMGRLRVSVPGGRGSVR